MKLLILTQKVDKNDDGVLGFFHGWVNEFAKHCEQVIVIALEARDYDLPNNVKVLSLGKEQGKSRLKYAFNFYKYIWSERKNYDNVFVHMNPEYIVLGGLFWRLMGKKIGLWYMHKSVDLKLRLAEKLTYIIFSATPESFRLKTKKLNITGHGIDVEQFISKDSLIKNKAFRVVTVGRISPIKDYETLIDAIKILQKYNSKIELDIIGGVGKAGQEKYLESLKKKVKNDGLEEVINFIGPVPTNNIVNYLQESNLFVNTSHTGSLDKTILEAMSCGLITISSNDSSKNVFGVHQDKLFFKLKDSSDLSQKIIGIINLSEHEKEKIKLDLRKEVERSHNLEDLIKKIIFIYQK
ncbi:MAG: glycosyltransferase [Patescibacteria group bacterium]|nr:glycosyltransferase [Patescibacteria group bacterium]